jgi:hypothetical protein
MVKPISARPHGVLDYSAGIFLLVSPWLFGFNDVSTAATITMVVFGLVVVVLSLLTNYPLGLIKLVPFSTHGRIETAGAIALLISPWLVRFADVPVARNIAVLVAIAWLGLVAFTNYSFYEAERPVR